MRQPLAVGAPPSGLSRARPVADAVIRTSQATLACALNKKHPGALGCGAAVGFTRGRKVARAVYLKFGGCSPNSRDLTISVRMVSASWNDEPFLSASRTW